jgi:hypothetical protein
LENADITLKADHVDANEPRIESTHENGEQFNSTQTYSEPEVAASVGVAKDESEVDSDPDLIDDGPPIKKRRNPVAKDLKVSSSQAGKAKAGVVKRKVKSKSLDKKQEELAKLKSQLAQCGVRKMWAKVLAPIDGESAQIAYLRNMLTEIGMRGRFSKAKAKAIKERREFEQDIKDMQEEAERFLSRSDEGHPATRGKKRVRL